MRGKWQKASYTVEAAIYLPIILFVFFQPLHIGIDFWQESSRREICEELQELDIVQEFYTYQVMNEIKEEIIDD